MTAFDVGQINLAGIDRLNRFHPANEDRQNLIQIGGGADFTYDVLDIIARQETHSTKFAPIPVTVPISLNFSAPFSMI